MASPRVNKFVVDSASNNQLMVNFTVQPDAKMCNLECSSDAPTFNLSDLRELDLGCHVDLASVLPFH